MIESQREFFAAERHFKRQYKILDSLNLEEARDLMDLWNLLNDSVHAVHNWYGICLLTIEGKTLSEVYDDLAVPARIQQAIGNCQHKSRSVFIDNGALLDSAFELEVK